jgi:hypothetical protein
MYKELGVFARHILFQRSIWKDGDIWTSIIGGVASYFWFKHDPLVIPKIQNHFGDLLSATSIVFGFALAALLFYIQTAATWNKDENVSKVADKIVDWHVWTIVCMLFLICWIFGLWMMTAYFKGKPCLLSILYAILVFQTLYCGFQILNHTLIVWWTFKRRTRLK